MLSLRAAVVLVLLPLPLWAGEAPAVRVVSLAPSITQTLRHIGAENSLIGVTAFCEAPENVARVAGGILAEPETVLGLAPDLVLCTSMTPATTREQMGRLGLRVELADGTSLEAIKAATERVAALLGVATQASAIAKGPADGPSVALLFGAETGYSAGRGSHAHGILEAAGLRNTAAEASGPWPQLSEEFLLRQDPEVLIIADYGGGERGEILAKLRTHPVRRHLRAVREGKIVVFPAGAFSVPGPGALTAPPKLRAAVDNL